MRAVQIGTILNIYWQMLKIWNVWLINLLPLLNVHLFSKTSSTMRPSSWGLTSQNHEEVKAITSELLSQMFTMELTILQALPMDLGI